MEWLNYHHLLYFWTIVREGGVAKAASRLRLAHPTISAQIRTLEAALGEKLFERKGRRLELTQQGLVAYGYADEIFTLGRELTDVLKRRAVGNQLKLVAGITQVVPKLIAKRLLEPARAPGVGARLVCREDKFETLLAELSAHTVDVVITDAPLPPGSAIRAYNHLLGECGVSVFGTRELAKRYRRRFPGSLEGAPMLLPGVTTTLRRALDACFESLQVRPKVEAEFDDSALAKVFGQEGIGLFVAPTPIADNVCNQYGVVELGTLPGVRERFYAISGERRVKHPAVSAVCEAARSELFARSD